MRWTHGLVLVSIVTAGLVAAPNMASASAPASGWRLFQGWTYEYDNPATLVNVAKEWNATSGTAKGNLSLTVQSSDHDRIRVINDVVASSNCVGCATVAIGFQIALISQPTAQVYAENKAFAYNTTCAGCLTVGLAFQFVVVTRTPLLLSPPAQAQLGVVATELDRLRTSNLAPAVIDALVTQQAATVRDLLSSSAAAANNPARLSVDRLADLTP